MFLRPDYWASASTYGIDHHAMQSEFGWSGQVHLPALAPRSEQVYLPRHRFRIGAAAGGRNQRRHTVAQGRY